MAPTLINRPLVVVQHHDHASRLLGDIVHRLERDAIRERGVTGDGHYVLVAARQVPCYRHSQRGRERCPGVPGPVAIMFALRPQHESVQPAWLANGVHALQSPGEHLVHIGLVAHVEKNLVLRSIEDRMQSDGELDHPKIRAKMPARLRKSLDERLADLLGQLGHLIVIQEFQVGGRMNGLEN